MLFVFSAVLSSFPPGTLRGNYSFYTDGCPTPSSPLSFGIPMSCFASESLTKYTTLCREYDVLCSSLQREVTHLTTLTNQSSMCTTHSWEWRCTEDEKTSCGLWWCDEIATCSDTLLETCECPEGMLGDPIQGTCECPWFYEYNGTHCIDNLVWDDDIDTNNEDWYVGEAPSPLPTTQPTAAPTAIQIIVEDVEWAWLLFASALGVFCGIGVGLVWGIYYCKPASVAPMEEV